ncbi:Phospholipid scramblase 1 [Fukomys damarensis]|uniref:Phospholipid scramblase n=1 Tax=Fukomys damarensis TaxID=885580 RepID=A0A091DKY1_FUKDA|nr:Phospholipid scramblase 1 [Fukomys damarensis]
MNNQGQRIYFAEERNNRFLLYLCGISRPFTMTIYGNVGQDIITMNKALRCSCCWSSCCLQKLTVEAPPGEKIGYVYQYFHPFLPKFKIKNENKKDVLKIRGPCLVSNCLWDLNFNLLSLDEEIVIGNISKHCSGFVTAPSLTDADTFSIQFPIDLDVKNKALILGASFLIGSEDLRVLPVLSARCGLPATTAPLDLISREEALCLGTVRTAWHLAVLSGNAATLFPIPLFPAVSPPSQIKWASSNRVQKKTKRLGPSPECFQPALPRRGQFSPRVWVGANANVGLLRKRFPAPSPGARILCRQKSFPGRRGVCLLRGQCGPALSFTFSRR